MASSQILSERIEAARRQLKKLRRHFQLSMWITGIVGLAVLLYMGGFFWFGYSEISDFKNPEGLVSLVEQRISEQIPLVRKRLQSQVDENATTWAKQASQQVVANVPKARQQLEELACTQADKLIDQADVFGEKEFRKLLDENRQTLQQAFQDLENNAQVSDGVLILLEKELEKEMKMSMENQAGTVLTIVSDLNRNGKNLLAAKNLSEEQQHERRVLLLMRRLQLIRFGEGGIQQLTSPVATGIVEGLEQKRIQQEAASAGKKTAPPAKEKAAPAVKEKTAPAVKEKAVQPAKEKAAAPAEEKAAKPAKETAAEPAKEKAAEAKD